MLPDSVQIGSYKYKVESISTKDLSKGFLGSIDHNINLIRVSSSAPPSRQLGILLHECLHGMLISYEFKNEERIILALEETLALFLRDNPHFVSILTSVLSDEKNNL